YLDGEQLTLVHYCDAGNRPRMTGKMSPDGKTVEFELKDISGSTEHHMHHGVFTIIDANHHTEDWTFMMKDKPIHAHFDLHRTHYCDAGNRPRMVGKVSPDGKTVEFEFLDVSGSTQYACSTLSSTSLTPITPKNGSLRWRTAKRKVDCWT